MTSVVVAPSTGAIAVGAGAVTVPLANDTQVSLGTLGLVVSDNGWVATGGGNSNSYIPWPADLLLNPATAVYAWTDLDHRELSCTSIRQERLTTCSSRSRNSGTHSFDSHTPFAIHLGENNENGDARWRSDYAILIGAAARQRDELSGLA